jgi:ADP-dependent NAD(P)H-hydrate dehydratase
VELRPSTAAPPPRPTSRIVPSLPAEAATATAPERPLQELGADVASRWPLPDLANSSSKHDRGTVLVIGGSVGTPGSVLLAGVAALRAGAGRVQVATTAETAVAVASMLPEARVMALPSRQGEIQPEAIGDLASTIAAADAILVGTGGIDSAASAAVASAVIKHLGDRTAIVVDAAALAMVEDERHALGAFADRLLLIPNGGEAARLLQCDRAYPEEAPIEAVGALVARYRCTLAVRMSTTYLAAPEGPVYCDRSGHPALGTSGSGDVLAGLVTGILASGADPLSAVIRAVRCHGLAGRAACARMGGMGILARELLEEIPRLLQR